MSLFLVLFVQLPLSLWHSFLSIHVLLVFVSLIILAAFISFFVRQL